ncbi:hypothetical protein FRC17_008762 [Serendipita sp. 399]|nr:hypothetical protein FRC17_008762 [Serendipita sp. 399]
MSRFEPITRRGLNKTTIRKYAVQASTSTPSTSATASTSSSSSPFRPYPFSSKVQSLPVPTQLIPNSNRFLTNAYLKHPFKPTPLQSLRKGIGLMTHLSQTLPNPRSHTLFSSFFARRGKGRIYPGSVLTVTLSKPPYTFSGVLMSIRRKGADSNILLRNVVRKMGVEMRIFLGSPTLLGIKVVQRAGGSTVQYDNAPVESRRINPPSTSTSTSTSSPSSNQKKKKATTVASSRAKSKPQTGQPFTKKWKVGTRGQVPTIRIAHTAGIIRDPTRKRLQVRLGRGAKSLRQNNKQDNKEAEEKKQMVKALKMSERGGLEPVQVDEKEAPVRKRMSRARLYFLRDYPSKMSAISAGITKRE